MNYDVGPLKLPFLTISPPGERLNDDDYVEFQLVTDPDLPTMDKQPIWMGC